MERDSSSSRNQHKQPHTHKPRANREASSSLHSPITGLSQSYNSPITVLYHSPITTIRYDMLSALSARRVSSTSRMAAAVATPLRQAWDALVGGANIGTNVRTNVRTNVATNQSPFDSIHDATVCHHLPPPHHQTALWLAVPKQKVTRHKKRLKTTVQKRIPLRRDIVTDPRTGETTLRHKMPFNWKDYLPGQVF
jgi:ribosomal protein L32